jgi:hypothetical protein
MNSGWIDHGERRDDDPGSLLAKGSQEAKEGPYDAAPPANILNNCSPSLASDKCRIHRA